MPAGSSLFSLCHSLEPPELAKRKSYVLIFMRDRDSESQGQETLFPRWAFGYLPGFPHPSGPFP
jgi:hypothetical protein